jgi:hypothetical protein
VFHFEAIWEKSSEAASPNDLRQLFSTSVNRPDFGAFHSFLLESRDPKNPVRNELQGYFHPNPDLLTASPIQKTIPNFATRELAIPKTSVCVPLL